jgi:hypothetical protein
MDRSDLNAMNPGPSVLGLSGVLLPDVGQGPLGSGWAWASAFIVAAAPLYVHLLG